MSENQYELAMVGTKTEEEFRKLLGERGERPAFLIVGTLEGSVEFFKFSGIKEKRLSEKEDFPLRVESIRRPPVAISIVDVESSDGCPLVNFNGSYRLLC